MRRLLACLICLALVGCKSATGMTVGGGVTMGVGGATAAGGLIGLVSSTETSNQLGVDNPVNVTYTAILISGGVIFLVGSILLASGVSKREEDLKSRDQQPHARPSAPAPRISKQSKGIRGARLLFGRLPTLTVADVMRAYRSLDGVEQALFASEWRALVDRKPSRKASAVIKRMIRATIETPHTETATRSPQRSPRPVLRPR